MGRPKRSYADKTRGAFLKYTVHETPHEAIASGARPEEEWLARMEGKRNCHYIQNGRKARRAVKARHPMDEVQNGSK